MVTEPKKVKKLETTSERSLHRVYLDIDFDLTDCEGAEELDPWYQVGRKGVMGIGFVESEWGEPVLEIELQRTKVNWRGDSDLEVWQRNFIQIPVINVLFVSYQERGRNSACCGQELSDR